MDPRMKLGEWYEVVRGKGPGDRDLIEAMFFPRSNDIYGYAVSIEVEGTTLKLAVDIDSCGRRGISFSGELRRVSQDQEVLWDPAPNGSDRGTHLDFEVAQYDLARRTGVLKLHHLRIRPGYDRPDLFVV